MTCYDLDNGVTLCYQCHRNLAHSRDFERQRDFHKWIEEYKGREFLEALEEKSHRTIHHTRGMLEDIKTSLKDKLKYYEEMNETT